MKEKQTNNLGLKIISVFLAFLVWLAVVNVSNPEISGTQEVPLEVINGNVLESNNMTYELLTNKSTVTVSYRVQTLDAGSIRSSDFRAYIDLAEMYEPTGSVPVKVEVLNHKNLFIGTPAARPGAVRIRTEELQRKRFELGVKTSGTLEDGYTTGEATLTPSYIYASGPVSRIGQISSAGIEIEMENANANLVGTAKPVLYDANGNRLDEDDRITLSRTEIDYELSILRVKNLALNFETEGRVADGYRFTGVESKTNSVAVVGLKSQLADISSITIPRSELNMDGAAGDLEVTVDLTKYLPEGVVLADGNHELTVTLKVEPLEDRTYALNTSFIRQIGASSQYTYHYGQNTVNVVVRGLKEDLDQLTAEAMGAELDVSGLELGTHPGVITFQLGTGYELVQYDQPEITVGVRGGGSEAETAGETEEGSGTEETKAKETATTEETEG